MYVSQGAAVPNVYRATEHAEPRECVEHREHDDHAESADHAGFAAARLLCGDADRLPVATFAA
ncbi:hypothetical protein [Embleya scabrispora]|uniref:hypothetical protein n=1 Tax=Embleya scabrispora TaxID=159449 RepID=UPI0013CC5338|nr:hypothetical protein [Embleya scabrispora]MYS80818.1 hypothetical protein [Streptomyces sp. SID5474]